MHRIVEKPPAHTSMFDVFAKNQTVDRSQPSYSLDFFPYLKTPMKGKCFAIIEEIKGKSKQELLVIPNHFRRVSRIGINAVISVLHLRAVSLKWTR